MLCIKDSNTDPYFNLAADEYVLKNFSEDCFMLWRNEPSIIIGKHQNALAEINLDFVNEKNIRVVRRISGGGAVYHDPGNLNFSFITTGKEGNQVNFRKFTQPIIDVLMAMEVEAKFEGRSDLTVGGRKISGNAEHVWKNRTLHHGTLLFSTVLSDLSASLKSDPLKFNDKAVKSLRSAVTNISRYIRGQMDILEFRDRIMDHIMGLFKNSILYQYSSEDIAGIVKLRDEKYIQWEWNYGYSPKYDFENKIQTTEGSLEFQVNVDKGYIKEIRIYGDSFNERDTVLIEKSLAGIKHDKDAITRALMPFMKNDLFVNIRIEEFVGGLF